MDLRKHSVMNVFRLERNLLLTHMLSTHTKAVQSTPAHKDCTISWMKVNFVPSVNRFHIPDTGVKFRNRLVKQSEPYLSLSHPYKFLCSACPLTLAAKTIFFHFNKKYQSKNYLIVNNKSYKNKKCLSITVYGIRTWINEYSPIWIMWKVVSSVQVLCNK